MYSVREATPLDILLLGSVYEAYEEELEGYGGLIPDRDFALGNLARTISDDAGILLLAFDGTKVVGFMWGSLAQMPWSPTLLAQDYLYYVHPDYRGKLIGKKLINSYVLLAQQKGAEYINLSIGSGINEQSTSKLIEHCGFSRLGTAFRRS